MEQRDNQNSDLSKAQNQQQPQQAQGQQPPEQAQGKQPPETGQASEDQSDTTTEQRSDVEGGSASGQASDIEGTSFLGADGSSDTSGELIEEDDSSDFAKDSRGDGE